MPLAIRLRYASVGRVAVVWAMLMGGLVSGRAQGAVPPAASAPQVSAPVGPATVAGLVTDTDGAAVPGARVALENADTKASVSSASGTDGSFSFASVTPGNYVIMIAAKGFAPWKIRDVIIVHEGEGFVVPTVELGVESINTSVNAITIQDLAERQITAEEHQRILGILPNFYVSYLPHAAPLTPRQKFKLAAVVSTDPLTFFTTAVTAGIEQAEGDFQGYGQGFSGYAERYAATYGDRLSATFLGSALFPTIFHQDPRYFYRGHGHVVVRALYAISTTVICKGDNGKFQPNYSNVLGNIGAGFISGAYYPKSDQHSLQVTFDNALIGIAYGSFGTLFQEFLLKHVTHGVPAHPGTQP